MESQLKCSLPKLFSSVTQDNFKDLRSLDDGKTTAITVRVAGVWEELDCMSTNKVTNIDMVIADGEEFHVVIPKNSIWKFDKVREGSLYRIEKLHLTSAKPKFRPAHNDKRGSFRCNTSITALDAYSFSITPHRFTFTEFEDVESNLQNLHLADVVGYLKTFTNFQVLQKVGGKASCMREITIEDCFRFSQLNMAGGYETLRLTHKEHIAAYDQRNGTTDINTFGCGLFVPASCKESEELSTTKIE